MPVSNHENIEVQICCYRQEISQVYELFVDDLKSLDRPSESQHEGGSRSNTQDVGPPLRVGDQYALSR